MRIALVIALAMAAGACGAEPAAEPTETESAAVAAAPATPAEVPAPAPGDYLAVQADGKEQPFTMKADGTFTATSLKGEPAKGTWVQKDGKTCFTSDPPSEEDDCWTNQPAAADGTWQSTSDKGNTVTVKPAP